MPLIAVTSSEAGAGKTGVAAAIARTLAYHGLAVRLVRTVGADTERAAEDAAYFSTLPFAPGSPGAPVEAASTTEPADGAVIVVESSAPVAGARTVVVSRRGLPEGTAAQGAVAIVVTDMGAHSPDLIPGSLGSVPVIALPEDRALAGFSISEARAMLNAEVLVVGDEADATCDYLVIAPISSDAGQPYFRRFHTKAVVVRFDKTDMHLAAMQADPQCLILTGGRRPSDYLFDAASARGIPVMLSRTDTENTVIALERIFDRTRFQGDRKLDRMAALLGASPLFDSLLPAG